MERIDRIIEIAEALRNRLQNEINELEGNPIPVPVLLTKEELKLIRAALIRHITLLKGLME